MVTSKKGNGLNLEGASRGRVEVEEGDGEVEEGGGRRRREEGGRKEEEGGRGEKGGGVERRREIIFYTNSHFPN
jgi:hypothetical protein